MAQTSTLTRTADRVDTRWLYDHYYDHKVEVFVLIPETATAREWYRVVEVQRQHSASSRWRVTLALPGGGVKDIYAVHLTTRWNVRWQSEAEFHPRTVDRAGISRAVAAIVSRGVSSSAQITDVADDVADYVLGLLEREGKARG